MSVYGCMGDPPNPGPCLRHWCTYPLILWRRICFRVTFARCAAQCQPNQSPVASQSADKSADISYGCGRGVGSILHFFSLLRESARHQCRHAGHGGRGRVRAPHSNLDWFTGREICVNDEKTLSGGGGMRMIWIRCYPELLSSWSSDLYPTMEAHGPLPSPKVGKQRPVTAFHACGPRNFSEICIRAAESKIVWNILWKHGTF